MVSNMVIDIHLWGYIYIYIYIDRRIIWDICIMMDNGYIMLYDLL